MHHRGGGCRTSLAFLLSQAAHSQFLVRPKRPYTKTPSAEKIVERYLKALGGKKRAAAVTDATYDWIIQTQRANDGRRSNADQAPGSFRSEMTFANGQ